MNLLKIDKEIFVENYLSVVQILIKWLDTTFLFGEQGRGSGKTTHEMAPRLDRIQEDMPGSIILLAAAAYKDIFDNILPFLMAYFFENYERGVYFEIGKEPPVHFKRCDTYIDNWRHTISFHNGTVVQFGSCDRPESTIGKSVAHLILDEMLRVKRQIFEERMVPTLRADRSKYGHSHYFMGITGFSSTPNFETDEDWFLKFEKDQDAELQHCIIEMAAELDRRLYELEIANKKFDDKAIKKLDAFVQRWSMRLNEFRRGETSYIRASSFSNIKILGIDYIENQIKSIKDVDSLNTSIFAIRKNKVKDMFFGRFSKEHIQDEEYVYQYIDTVSADGQIEETSRNLKYCDPRQPLYMGYDPGPFTSAIFAQRKKVERKFISIKNFCVIHPEQQEELADKINKFFKYHQRKEIFIHYDRAANQRDPKWKQFYPNLTGDINDTDSILLERALKAKGWIVHLMSRNQPIITYGQHYRLLNLLFGKTDGKREEIMICRNECDALISSINHSPLKRHEGKIILDKSSEKELEYKDQEYNSTQLATAYMYLLWGEFNKLLPESDRRSATFEGSGTYSA
jgi:hypothetical protein